MKSEVLPSFWAEYRQLSNDVRQRARKAYRLWAENPFHPSLHFKCINQAEAIWSVRVTRGVSSSRIQRRGDNHMVLDW